MKISDFQAPCWPTARQRLLLQACLGTDATAVAGAWQAWREVQDFDQIDWGSARFMPLLLRQLERFGLVDPQAGRYRGLQRRAWVRSQQICQQLVQLSRSLGQAGIPVLLLKGAPLGALYYPDHGLRPMGDGDLLIPHGRAAQTIDWLVAEGWRPTPAKEPAALHRFHLGHNHSWGFTRGMGPALAVEVDLHWKLLHLGVTPEQDARFWARSQPVTVQGVELRTLAAEHHLFHVLVHGVPFNVVPGFRWVADALMILRQAGAGLDWSEFVGCVRDFQVGVLVNQALTYLDKEFAAPVPEAVRAQVAALAQVPRQIAEFRVLERYPPTLHPVYLWHRYQRQRALEPEERRRTWVGGYLEFVRNRWELESRWQLPGEFARKTRQWLGGRRGG